MLVYDRRINIIELCREGGEYNTCKGNKPSAMLVWASRHPPLSLTTVTISEDSFLQVLNLFQIADVRARQPYVFVSKFHWVMVGGGVTHKTLQPVEETTGHLLIWIERSAARQPKMRGTYNGRFSKNGMIYAPLKRSLCHCRDRY